MSRASAGSSGWFRAFECPDCERLVPGPTGVLALVVECPDCEGVREYAPVKQPVADGGEPTRLAECPVCGAVGLPERIDAHDCQSFLDRRGLDDRRLVTDGGRGPDRVTCGHCGEPLDADDVDSHECLTDDGAGSGSHAERIARQLAMADTTEGER